MARVFEPWSPFDKFDSFFIELFAYFAEPRAWSLYPEVLNTLAALKQRGLRLSVISNFHSRLVPILHGLGADHFSIIFLCRAVSVTPNPTAKSFTLP